MSRGWRLAGSASGPPLRPLWMDPGKDECARTASPQRTFGAVFISRARRRLRSTPPQIFPRISLENPTFSLGFPPRRGCRRVLRDAPPARALHLPLRSSELRSGCRCGALNAPLRAARPPTRGPGPHGPQHENIGQTSFKILAVVRSEIVTLRMLIVKRVVMIVQIEKSAKTCLSE